MAIKEILCLSTQAFAEELRCRKELNLALAWEFPVGQLKLLHMHLAVFFVKSSEPSELQIFKHQLSIA